VTETVGGCAASEESNFFQLWESVSLLPRSMTVTSLLCASAAVCRALPTSM
jgi:hypothetical protein